MVQFIKPQSTGGGGGGSLSDFIIDKEYSQENWGNETKGVSARKIYNKVSSMSDELDLKANANADSTGQEPEGKAGDIFVDVDTDDIEIHSSTGWDKIAKDTEVVHKGQTETITGPKTFQGNIGNVEIPTGNSTPQVHITDNSMDTDTHYYAGSIQNTVGGVTYTYPFPTKNSTLATLADISAAGGGDVTGPNSSVNGNIVSFDGTTGKVIKDSGFSAIDFDDRITTLEADIDTKVKDVKVDGTSVVDANKVAQIDLSGKQDALTAGNNISITGGEPLPSGYTRLEYIQSSGTQYINTGYTLTSDNVKYNITFSNLTGSAISLFGAEQSNSPKYSGVPYYPGTNLQLYIGNSQSTGGTATLGSGTNSYVVDVFGQTSGRVIINGVENGFTYSGGLYKGKPIYLFANNGTSGAQQIASYRLYRFSITDNSVLRRDFVPARRDSDNAVGLYDNVTDVFFENIGTGTFTGGQTVSNTLTISAIDTTYSAGTGISINNNVISSTVTSDVTDVKVNGTSVVDANKVANIDLSGYATNTALTQGLATKQNTIDARHKLSYDLISGTPTIPTVNNATLTIQKNGTNVATFTANSSTNQTANITVPTALSSFTNDSGFITNASISDTAFGSSWDGDTTHAPSKNAIYGVLGGVETLLANI